MGEHVEIFDNLIGKCGGFADVALKEQPDGSLSRNNGPISHHTYLSPSAAEDFCCTSWDVIDPLHGEDL